MVEINCMHMAKPKSRTVATRLELRRMARNRSLLMPTIILAALLARYGPRNDHQVAIISSDGDFKFFADERPDGSHTYESTYVWENGWLLTPQAESGRLSDKDWQTIKSLRKYETLPKFEESDFRDPGDVWGVLQRGNETIILRNAEWNDLAATQVNESLWSMVVKAKASL